jgi:hypothetical protein
LTNRHEVSDYSTELSEFHFVRNIASGVDAGGKSMVIGSVTLQPWTGGPPLGFLYVRGFLSCFLRTPTEDGLDKLLLARDPPKISSLPRRIGDQ